MLRELLKDTKRYSDDIQSELKRLRDSKKDIYIFGGILGGMSLGAEVRRFLDKNEVDIKGYIANKEFVTSNFYCNKPVFRLEDETLPKEIAIVIGMISIKEKTKELNSYGYNDLYFFNIIRDSFGYSEFEEYFVENELKFDETYNLLADELSKKVMIGYLQDRIYNNYNSLIATQDKRGYFNNLMKFDNDEIMVDCGAYDGDTALEFVKQCPNYKHIYAFEPDMDNFEKLKHNTRDLNITCIQKGVYNKDGVLYFKQSGDNGGGCFNVCGDVELPVCAIDSLGGGATFIKMDIEGSELEALKGAQQTIKNFKPKLAICIYHKKEDLITIPQYILSLNKNYKLYLRNRQGVGEDTVIYAI